MSDADVETYVESLPWSPDAPVAAKAVVAGNIRSFAAWLRGRKANKCRCGARLILVCSHMVRDLLANQPAIRRKAGKGGAR